jgi:hypothetical protein
MQNVFVCARARVCLRRYIFHKNNTCRGIRGSALRLPSLLGALDIGLRPPAVCRKLCWLRKGTAVRQTNPTCQANICPEIRGSKSVVTERGLVLLKDGHWLSVGPWRHSHWTGMNTYKSFSWISWREWGIWQWCVNFRPSFETVNVIGQV